MISGDFPPRISGVGDYAFHISSTASKMGLNVTAICTQNSNSKASSLYGTLDVRPVMAKWFFSEIKKICQVLRESGENTVVNIQYGCLAYGRQLMINFLPLILRMLFPRVKIVITLHGFWEQSVLFRMRALPMLRFSHGIIYVDRLNKELVKKYSGHPDERLQFIHIAGNIPPIPCTEEQRNIWRKELGFEDKDTILVFFGGMGIKKGFDCLIESMGRIEKKNLLPSFFLLAIGSFHTDMVGEAHKKYIISLISKLGIEKNVCFFEHAKPIDVSKYLHIADLAVFPFDNGVGENSGSMLAALAHGLPTIITSGPANNASFSDKYGVIMVPAKNPEILAGAINNIINMPDRQKILRNKAREISMHLNWEFVTRESINFFSSL